MLDLALASFSASWPELIRPHPYLLLALFICGLVLFFWSFISSLFSKTDIPPSPVLASVQAPIDVAPHNTVSQIVNNYLTPPSSKANVDSSVGDIRQVETTKANIVFHGLTNSLDKIGNLVGTKPGVFICLLSIENLIPDSGKTCCADSVCASIRVSGANGLTAFVQRAYWYSYLENEIEFPISSVRQVVVGWRAEDRWVLCGNPNQFRPNFRRGSVLHGAELKSLPLTGGGIIAEIRIFNRRTGDVYLTQKIQISVIAEDVMATVVLP